MNKISYAEKLKDPRWQQLRLRVLERDEWKCRDCGDSESELQVHHSHYGKNREPWEADPNWIGTYCWPCHVRRQQREQSAKDVFGTLLARLYIESFSRLEDRINEMINGGKK